jgi:hypothetical protein
MYWILVDLEQDPPSFYVVPNWWMENDIYTAHADYLSQHGGTRAVSPKSRHHAIRPHRVEQWLERWDELGL